MPVRLSPEAFQKVEVLVQAVRALPGARPDRVGIFGHSRGGVATLNSFSSKTGISPNSHC
jgi:dipeptidyl aminopeptidase/acylaminoacyl peptidase